MKARSEFRGKVEPLLRKARKSQLLQKESEKKVKKSGKKCGKVKKQLTFCKKACIKKKLRIFIFSLPAFLWPISLLPQLYINKPCPHFSITCEERRRLYIASTSALHQKSASGKLPWLPSSFPKPYYVPYTRSMCMREQ